MTFSIKRSLCLASLLCVAMTALAKTPDQYSEALAGWGRVLEQHVDDQGRIDFYGLAEQPDELLGFVEAIAGFGPASHPEHFGSPQQVLAYHINAYNALAMHGVIERDIPDGFTSFFKRASFFRFRDVTIAGRNTNLYDYENKVIRPLGEPRAHFALNCMVRDCPRLPRVPFSADKLEEQLEAASWEFFNTEKHLRLDHENMRIYVSAILDFYTRDFVASGKAADLPQYINRYRKEALPNGYKVRYIDYDWRINQQ